MSRTPLCLAIAAATLTGGCHAKFKDAVPDIDAINIQVLTTGGPYVQLGHIYGDDSVVSGVINVVQDVRGAYQADKIERAVYSADIEEALEVGIADTLGHGAPFGVTAGDPDAPTLQIEVTSYGLMVPMIGVPGSFTVSAKARMYNEDGRRIYKKNLHCNLGLDADGLEGALPLFNNVEAIQSMTDEELNQAFATMGWLCGQQLVVKMRQHAG
jgi:hypothetical protein